MKIKLEELKMVDKDIDLDEYINFRTKIKESMIDASWLGEHTKETLKGFLKDGARLWVYYKEHEPVCSMMVIPSTKKDVQSFGFDFDYQKTIYYGPMMVNRKYVGNGLQYQMLLEEDKYAKENGYLYAAVTCHPDNIYSVNNLLKDGFEKKTQKVFNRGVRNIYFKKL